MKIWHQVVESGDMNLLDDILDKDCIFYSPVVFSPQAGKEITKNIYLPQQLFSLMNPSNILKKLNLPNLHV